MGEMTMIERVARAMSRGVHNRKVSLQAQNDPSWSAYCEMRVDRDWRQFEDNARDALNAMREPTKAMERASRLTHDFQSGNDILRVVMWGSNALPAMIDAALSEQF